MGLNLASLANKKHSRTFDFDGTPVTIDVLPHKITPEYRVKLAELAKQAASGEDTEDQKQKEQDAQMVADLMPNWDVEWVEGEGDGESKPYPPTYENLLTVPCTLLGRVASEIMEVIKVLSNPLATKSKK